MLVDLYQDQIRYCTGRGWLVWDGSRWAFDDRRRIIELAKDTATRLYTYAARLPLGDEDEVRKRNAQMKKARGLGYVGRLKAMAWLAQSDPRIVVSTAQLDADPWLLNAANGTIDLRTGTLHGHDRDKLITRLAPIAYDPEAEAPQWDRFIKRIMAGDDELARYNQRVFGYASTGDTSEQAIFVCHGPGQNGKSLQLKVIRQVLGDYALNTPTSTFMRRGRDVPTNDLARLVGVRFVTAVEAERGQQLGDAVVKQLTGGDFVTARFLYQELFDFTPEFKAFLAVNHLPETGSTDEAVWRRIHVLPYLVTIPPEEQDKYLFEKLWGEASGILAWLVRGCLEWQRIGLVAPEVAVQAVRTYRADMETQDGLVARFLDDCCERVPGAFIKTVDLHAQYELWREEAGLPSLSLVAFGRQLREQAGLSSAKEGRARGWKGVRFCNRSG